MMAGEITEENVQQEAAPVVLFQGAGLKSSSAAVVSPQTDEEFDYAFNHGSREVHATTNSKQQQYHCKAHHVQR